jgi:hypothetical protein
MSKAIVGAAELGGAVAMGAAAFLDPALIASPFYDKLMASLVISGLSNEAGAIADALTSNRGMAITTRQPAGFRQIVVGTQRIPGVIVYESTTGSHHDQWNYIIVLATHEIDSIEALYLDGRKVHFSVGSGGNSTRNGVNFGGSADHNTYVGPNGQHYNFGTLVYCEARYGDQAAGDVISGMTANDPTWAASGGKSPYAGGCAYVYLKIEHDTSMFPGLPEIKFTVRGKNNILDPRTGTRGYTTNWALIVADMLTDPDWGLGDNTVNQAQLIAAANVCDEQVTLASGQTEARYAASWHYDTSTAVGDAISTIMSAAAGRLSRIGGEWFIWPAYWQGPSFTFDEGALVGGISWTKRSVTDLINRVTGTYTAPNFPYNVAGNLYDSNGWYDGSIQNNFPYAFQPTNYPQYAADELHGYGAGVDVYLTEDGGIPHPKEIAQPCCLSIAQAQRVAKIYLLRNRQQGSGSFPMSLSAWQMEPTDVMQFSMASPQNWANKYLELVSLRFRCQEVRSSDGKPARALFVQCGVQETDPSVYEWPISEELTPYDVPAAPNSVPYIVEPPTNLAIEDDASTAATLQDGSTMPRVLVTWTPPDDTYVANGGKIEVQYALNTSGTIRPIVFSGPALTQNGDGTWSTPWIDAGAVSGIATSKFIDGISTSQFQNITVQIRAVRSGGAASAWVSVSNHVLPVTWPVIPIHRQTGSVGPRFVFFGTGKDLGDLEPAQAGADVTAQNGNVQLQNPNFAAGDTGWTKQTGWSVVAPYSGYFNPFDGSGYMGQFSASTATTGACINNQKFAVHPGNVVKAQCEAYGLAGAAADSAYIRINFYDLQGNLLSTVAGNSISVTSAWQQSAAVATAPANTSLCQIDFAIINGTGLWFVASFQAALMPDSLDIVPDSASRFAAAETAADQTGNRLTVLSGAIPNGQLNPTFSYGTDFVIGRITVNSSSASDMFMVLATVADPLTGSFSQISVRVLSTVYAALNVTFGVLHAAITGLAAGSHDILIIGTPNQGGGTYALQSSIVTVQQLAAGTVGGFVRGLGGAQPLGKPSIS